MQRALTRRLSKALGGSNGANGTEWAGYGRSSHSSRVTVRSVRNRVGAIALLVLLSLGCSPTSSVPSSTPSSTGASPLGVPTGFRGGVLTGVTLEIPGARIPNDWTRAIQAEGPSIGEGAMVRFTSKLLDATCENFPASLPCPAPEEAVLGYRISVLLDLNESVPAPGPMGTRNGYSFTHAGASRMETVVPLDLPPLPRGRHCLLVAALEDDMTIIEGQFPDHSNIAMFWLQVGEENVDFCHAQMVASPVLDLAPQGPVASCAYPFLTTEPGDYTKDSVSGRGLWAVLAECEDTTSVVVAVDGILQSAAQPLGPRLLPAGEGNGVAYAIDAPNQSTIRALTVSTSSVNDAAHTGYSRPVRVQP